jgi:hypothetical protein
LIRLSVRRPPSWATRTSAHSIAPSGDGAIRPRLTIATSPGDRGAAMFPCP